MDLHSNHPYWLIKDGTLSNYPRVTSDLKCQVLVMGAGISGALIAARLVEAGLDVVVVDKRQVGTGSTCANTGLILYENDEHLTSLRRKVGREKADTAYRISSAILDQIPGWIEKAGGADFCGYRPKHSLYLASTNDAVDDLRQECTARREIGVPCEVLESDDIQKQYGLKSPLALRTSRAAECDSFAFTHGLLRYGASLGARIFECTTLCDFKEHDSGITAQTDNGYSITADQLVIASGYESQAYLDHKVARNLATYVIISEPVRDLPKWWFDTHIWETARPYLYMRSTPDGRIIVGGEDDDFSTAEARDAALYARVRKLESNFSKLFPDLPIAIDLAWAGTFAVTPDGLPRIGRASEWHNVYFALGYGGNGITFSLIAAEIIAGEITGKPLDYAGAFAFQVLS